MKKTLCLLLCLAMLTGLASVAVAESTDSTYVNTGKLQYDATKEVNNGQPMTIEFWVQSELSNIYQKWCDAYTALHPNITFNITLASHDDHFTKLGMALPAGTGPDMFHMHNAYADQLIPNMKPYDFNVMPLDILREDFSLTDENLYDGKLYYMGVGIMTGGIFYNKTLWAQAGLTDADFPKTWDDLAAVAKKLTQVDATGKMQVAGFNYNEMMMDTLINAMDYQKGQAMFERDSKIPVFNQNFIDTVQWLKNLYDVDKVCTTEMPMSIVSFSQSTTAMVYCWGWYSNWLTQNAPDLDYGFFPSPSWDGETPAVYDRLNMEVSPAINANVSDEKYAVINDFLCYFLSNDNANLDFSLSLSTAPARKCLAQNEKVVNDPVLSVTMAKADRLLYPGAFPEAYMTSILNNCYAGVMLNGVSVEDAMNLCREEITDAMDSTDFVSLESRYAHADELSFE
ncbi:MAG: extracellular solute-binding protein [Candidatus Limiplasma sp.]|nr:extracellular solute-binding protein [Candidatus Limiplasma sp.]